MPIYKNKDWREKAPKFLLLIISIFSIFIHYSGAISLPFFSFMLIPKFMIFIGCRCVYVMFKLRYELPHGGRKLQLREHFFLLKSDYKVVSISIEYYCNVDIACISIELGNHHTIDLEYDSLRV